MSFCMKCQWLLTTVYMKCQNLFLEKKTKKKKHTHTQKKQTSDTFQNFTQHAVLTISAQNWLDMTLKVLLRHKTPLQTKLGQNRFLYKQNRSRWDGW